MHHLLPRSLSVPNPAAGLLLAEHFQMAYLTNDLDHAKALFAERLGICAFQDLGGPMPDGGTIKVALAWVGTIMYELMETSDSNLPLYAEWLPHDDGFHLRHHHLGYVVHNNAQFDAIADGAHRARWPVAHRNSNPLVDVVFVHAPELGHYLEYMLPTPAGLGFFDAVPRS
jgi:hypothetical protein